MYLYEMHSCYQICCVYILGSRFENDVDPFADDEADEECEEIMESNNPVSIYVAPCSIRVELAINC